MSYDGNGQITSWNPGSLPSGSEDHLSHLTIAGAATTSLEGRLVEFKNYRTPLIEKRDWGLISMQDGAGLATLDNGSGIESLTIAADGTAYFVRNGATVLDGVTYQRPMFKLQVGSQNPGQAAVATFVGDLSGALASLGAAATDPVTGLAAGLDGTLYGVVQHGDGSVPDGSSPIVNFLRDSSGQLINVFSQGLLQGSGSEVTSAGDLSFSSNGTLYVADDSDDEIYTVEKLTGAILGLHSSGDAGNLRGLAVNPADNDVTASDGGSNRIMRLIAGSANDTPYFDYAARFGMSDIRAISFYNGSFSPTESAAPYFAVDQTQRIFGSGPGKRKHHARDRSRSVRDRMRSPMIRPAAWFTTLKTRTPTSALAPTRWPRTAMPFLEISRPEPTRSIRRCIPGIWFSTVGTFTTSIRTPTISFASVCRPAVYSQPRRRPPTSIVTTASAWSGERRSTMPACVYLTNGSGTDEV